MALVMSAAGIHAAASITPDETLSALLDSLVDRAGDDRDVLQRVLRRARSAQPAGCPTPTPVIRTRSACPGSASPSGSRPRRRRSGWRRREASSGGRCHGRSDHDLLVLWTDGLVDARNDGGRAVRRAAAARRGVRPPDRGARGDRGGGAGGGGGVRRRSRSTTARCWSSGSSGAPGQAPPGPAFSHRSPDSRPHRRRARGRARTTRCSRSAPGRAGSPPRSRSGRAGWWRSRRTATWCPRSAQRFPSATIVEGDALETRLARRWRGRGSSSPATSPTTSPRRCIDKALEPPRPERIVFLVQKEVADRVDGAARASRTTARSASGVQSVARARAAVHRAGRGVPPAAEGRLRGAPADAAGRAAGRAGGAVRASARLVVGLFGFRRKQMRAGSAS